MTENDDKTKQLIEIIETGTEIAGAAVGGAVGFLVAGPIGAAGAGALGVVVAKSTEKIISEFANRHLSHREKVRIGAAAAFALSAIQDRLKEGDEPRDDGFFTRQAGKRSSADEIFEGVLLKSKNEHEEKKVRLLGNFFANLAFCPDISASEANHLLRVAENLTYRQMCLLALFSSKSKMAGLQLRKSDYYEYELGHSVDHKTISLYQEIANMFTQGLIVRLTDDRLGIIQSLSSWNEIAPDFMEPTIIGKQLASLLNVDVENNDDFNTIVSQLA